MNNKPYIEHGLGWFEKISKHIDISKPVRVYKNLHKSCWSIQQGTVRCHAEYLILKNVTFKVGEKTRQRVIREKKKFVHAYAIGFLCSLEEYNKAGDSRCDNFELKYNPYNGPYFNRETDGTNDFTTPIVSVDYLNMHTLIRPNLLATIVKS